LLRWNDVNRLAASNVDFAKIGTFTKMKTATCKTRSVEENCGNQNDLLNRVETPESEITQHSQSPPVWRKNDTPFDSRRLEAHHHFGESVENLQNWFRKANKKALPATHNQLRNAQKREFSGVKGIIDLRDKS
jgi:hypothetical protein